jgi:hypothetical protein
MGARSRPDGAVGRDEDKSRQNARFSFVAMGGIYPAGAEGLVCWR